MAQVNVQQSRPVPKAQITQKSEDDTRRLPLTYSGSLDSYKSFDLTPVIGREFPDVQLSTLLSDDRKIRDLAILGMTILGHWASDTMRHFTNTI